MLTTEQLAFWYEYSKAPPPTSGIHAAMPGNLAMADQLLALYLEGKKTAGSSLVRDYELAGDLLPKVGDYWIVLDGSEKPRALLRVVRVELHLFKDIPEEIARAEGEGDLSLPYWREAHAQFFAPYLKPWGIKDLESAEVITEFFSLVHQR